ncbi:MAG: DUF2695 domain-containing protein [Terracidiphilus sp.]|jgi:hypothetical protein
MEYDLTSDEEFLKNIASNVLGVLEKRSFFTRLDDLFCPVDPSIDRAKCGHSFDKSVSILRDLDMNLDDVDDVEDVLGVLRFRGACCDCEVLYNMAEESRLKSEYWKAHAKQLTRESRSLTTFA